MTTLVISSSFAGLLLTHPIAHADSSTSSQVSSNSGNEVINNGPNEGKDYNKSYDITKKVATKAAYFYATPGGSKRLGSTKPYFKKSLQITRIASVNGAVYYKTTHGWIAAGAFNQSIKYSADIDYKMKVTNSDVPVYNKPANTSGAQKIGTTASLGLAGKWYQVDRRADTNLKNGYYRFSDANGSHYWIAGRYMQFDLNNLPTGNAKVEKAISTGLKLVGKSKYSWGGGRTAASIAARQFDCSSFVHFVFSRAGVQLGSTSATTFTLKNLGRAISPANMKRGDIFFFNAKGEGAFCHVGIYLGDGLFLHDSPSSDTGGVGISTLKDKYWLTKFNNWVRRVA